MHSNWYRILTDESYNHFNKKKNYEIIEKCDLTDYF